MNSVLCSVLFFKVYTYTCLVFLRMHWHTNQRNSHYLVVLFLIYLCEAWWRLDHHPPVRSPHAFSDCKLMRRPLNWRPVQAKLGAVKRRHRPRTDGSHASWSDCSTSYAACPSTNCCAASVRWPPCAWLSKMAAMRWLSKMAAMSRLSEMAVMCRLSKMAAISRLSKMVAINWISKMVAICWISKRLPFVWLSKMAAILCLSKMVTMCWLSKMAAIRCLSKMVTMCWLSKMAAIRCLSKMAAILLAASSKMVWMLAMV